MIQNRYFSKKEIIVVFFLVIVILLGHFIYGNIDISQYECKKIINFKKASENELQELPYISFTRARLIILNKNKISNFEDLSRLLKLKSYERKVLIKRIEF